MVHYGRVDVGKNYNVFDENIYCVRNDIYKPFNMGILKHSEHMCEVLKMDELIPTLIRKNEEYHESSWDTKYMTYKEDIIRKTIKNSLTKSTQE